MFNKLYFNENISLPILWFGLVFEMCIFHSVWTSKDLGKSAEDETWSENRTFTPAESFLIPNFWVQISARKCDGVIGIHLQYYTDTYTAIDHFCIYVDITLRLMTIESLNSDTPEWDLFQIVP